jgi:hypothetical protein
MVDNGLVPSGNCQRWLPRSSLDYVTFAKVRRSQQSRPEAAAAFRLLRRVGPILNIYPLRWNSGACSSYRLAVLGTDIAFTSPRSAMLRN